MSTHYPDDKTVITQLTKGSILIVDDNPTNLELLSNLLMERQYEVKAAINGRRALAQVNLSHPDLIMLDINMPGMDGYEVCRRLKEDESTSRIPIIFISALNEVWDKVKAFEVGGIDYVTKPFQCEEVIARIETQMKLSQLQREMERKNAELTQKNQELLMAYQRVRTLFSTLAEVLPGTVLDNKYRLDTKIGSGGFGAVFQATHLNLNRDVAVKVFQPPTDENRFEELERFRMEGISACRVNHPNAITVLDSGVSPEGIAYLVMELLSGHTLFQELKQKVRLPLERCAEIIFPICDVLDAAQMAGIVHRDIKPENIFLHQSPDGEVVKVVDFGIAKLLGDPVNPNLPSLTLNGVVGTPAYMSPERFNRKDYDGQADIYSLGVLFYRMLTGSLPFDAADPVALALMHLTKSPQPPRQRNPEIPQAIETIILQMLSKTPGVRPTPRQLALNLQAALERIRFDSSDIGEDLYY